MKKELLEYSFKNKLAHIPSALSMIDYLQEVFKYINQKDNIIIGKPFGAQAYYLIWKNLGWINDIEKLSMGVKHDEIDFVDYSEETIGNALGVAAGISLVSCNKTYVNISDGCLQMGPTLEAIQFIGKRQTDVLVTVDYNNSQVTGKCEDIIPIKPVIKFFADNNWIVYVVDGHSESCITTIIEKAIKLDTPVVIFCKTIKGYGVKEMENNKDWHYRKLDEKNLTQIFEQITE